MRELVPVVISMRRKPGGGYERHARIRHTAMEVVFPWPDGTVYNMETKEHTEPDGTVTPFFTSRDIWVEGQPV